MTFSIWLSLLMICMLGAMSPGPSLAVVAKHSLAGGRLHGVVTSWAHAAGVGVYALVTLLGLAVVLKQSPTLFNVITYAGAGYLAYLGINALRSKGGVAAKLAAGQSTSLVEAARDGAMISLLNPKLALFFLALFSQFVAVGTEFSSRAVIVATPLLVDGLWYTLIAFVLSNPKVLEKLRTKAQLIDRLSGVVLILLAMRVVIQA
ncbi:LysE family translocator [Photobacterium gaetbulicola]|uniref:Putative threonine efflux protein n=1 Tax=Photobacterium gaetbulicola Gung47 TaxID=658445 RepID=A0A0C5WKS2_9GAMM|nr:MULTISPECIES: LysE family translocator [Photobacterium]AJR07738.1 putative threonine efflux protein [Photobacterium gaetbulicola Gung47]PSU01121.1 LysE family translocator [Photobacterium gaetbulicola]WEM42940.1 LysE family translocator [Photobacterium sp. DA100]